MDWHATVAVPELVTLVGEKAPQVNPVETVSVNDTVPVNPFTAVTVMVEDAETLTLTAAGELAAIVKSVIVNVAVAM